VKVLAKPISLSMPYSAASNMGRNVMSGADATKRTVPYCCAFAGAPAAKLVMKATAAIGASG